MSLHQSYRLVMCLLQSYRLVTCGSMRCCLLQIEAEEEKKQAGQDSDRMRII